MDSPINSDEEGQISNDTGEAADDDGHRPQTSPRSESVEDFARGTKRLRAGSTDFVPIHQPVHQKAKLLTSRDSPLETAERLKEMELSIRKLPEGTWKSTVRALITKDHTLALDILDSAPSFAEFSHFIMGMKNPDAIGKPAHLKTAARELTRGGSAFHLYHTLQIYADELKMKASTRTKSFATTANDITTQEELDKFHKLVVADALNTFTECLVHDGMLSILDAALSEWHGSDAPAKADTKELVMWAAIKCAERNQLLRLAIRTAESSPFFTASTTSQIVTTPSVPQSPRSTFVPKPKEPAPNPMAKPFSGLCSRCGKKGHKMSECKSKVTKKDAKGSEKKD